MRLTELDKDRVSYSKLISQRQPMLSSRLVTSVLDGNSIAPLGRASDTSYSVACHDHSVAWISDKVRMT